MKLAIYSDLHLEFGKFQPPALDVDVVVLAGDIGKKHYGLRWAAEAFPTQQIIYVCGNHEFYGERRDMVLSYLRKEQKKYAGRVHFLNSDEIVIDGVRFLGCTLWTDFALLGETNKEQAMSAAGRSMNDYFQIRRGPSVEGRSNRLEPIDTLHYHESSVNWLGERLSTPFDGATVVVTHHAPSLASVPDRFKESLVSAAYASNLDYLVEQSSLWIHGHTHDSLNYQIGGSTVLCNPRGYVGHEINYQFRQELVVSIQDGKLLAFESKQNPESFGYWLEKLEAVPVHQEDSVSYVLGDDIPEPWRDAFRKHMSCSTCPVIGNSRNIEAYYSWDYEAWLSCVKRAHRVE